MNNKSKNGKLIEEVVTNYVNKNTFEFTDGFKESLQDNLNSILNFETKVNDIESKNGFIFGTIDFTNESFFNSVINFTVTQNNEIIIEL